MNKIKPSVKRLLESIERNNNKEVNVFYLDGCPSCKSIKSKFDKLGVSYTTTDVNEETERWNDLVKETGEEFVPQVTVSGKAIKNFENVNELISKTISEMIGRKVILK